jgi:hypothetical protein
MSLWALGIIRNSVQLEKAFQKLDVFQSSYKWRETLTVLGPLERLNLNH